MEQEKRGKREKVLPLFVTYYCYSSLFFWSKWDYTEMRSKRQDGDRITQPYSNLLTFKASEHEREEHGDLIKWKWSKRINVKVSRRKVAPRIYTIKKILLVKVSEDYVYITYAHTILSLHRLKGKKILLEWSKVSECTYLFFVAKGALKCIHTISCTSWHFPHWILLL